MLPSKTQWTVSDNITVYRSFYFKKTLSLMNMPKEAFPEALPDLLCLIRQILDTLSFLPHLFSKVTGFGAPGLHLQKFHGQDSINPCRKE